MTVTILPPISTIGLTSEDVSQLAVDVRKSMLECFNKSIVGSSAPVTVKLHPQKGTTQTGWFAKSKPKVKGHAFGQS